MRPFLQIVLVMGLSLVPLSMLPADPAQPPIPPAPPGAYASISVANGGEIACHFENKNRPASAKSSLRRKWVAVHDAALPVGIVGTPGLVPVGNDAFATSVTLRLDEPVTAVEIKFIAFDVWGEVQRVLSLVTITDLNRGTVVLERAWPRQTSSEVACHYGSIAYVSRVRTAAGRVVRGELGTLVEAGRKFRADMKRDELNRALTVPAE